MSKFTLRHHIEIAELIGRANADKPTIDIFVKYFKVDNPRFKELKFRYAVSMARLAAHHRGEIKEWEARP